MTKSLRMFALITVICTLNVRANAKDACHAFRELPRSVSVRIAGDLKVVSTEYGETLFDIRQDKRLANLNPDVGIESYQAIQTTPDRQSVLLRTVLGDEPFFVVYNIRRGVVWSYHGNTESVRFLNDSTIGIKTSAPGRKHEWIEDFSTGELQDLTPIATRFRNRAIRLMESLRNN